MRGEQCSHVTKSPPITAYLRHAPRVGRGGAQAEVVAPRLVLLGRGHVRVEHLH